MDKLKTNIFKYSFEKFIPKFDFSKLVYSNFNNGVNVNLLINKNSYSTLPNYNLNFEKFNSTEKLLNFRKENLNMKSYIVHSSKIHTSQQSVYTFNSSSPLTTITAINKTENENYKITNNILTNLKKNSTLKNNLFSGGINRTTIANYTTTSTKEGENSKEYKKSNTNTNFNNNNNNNEKKENKKEDLGSLIRKYGIIAVAVYFTLSVIIYFSTLSLILYYDIDADELLEKSKNAVKSIKVTKLFSPDVKAIKIDQQQKLLEGENTTEDGNESENLKTVVKEEIIVSNGENTNNDKKDKKKLFKTMIMTFAVTQVFSPAKMTLTILISPYIAHFLKKGFK